MRLLEEVGREVSEGTDSAVRCAMAATREDCACASGMMRGTVARRGSLSPILDDYKRSEPLRCVFWKR